LLYFVAASVNGLPLVQNRANDSGIEIKETSTNQHYQNHSFLGNHGLFRYVQLFVSNGVNTMLANKLQSVKTAFFWNRFNNKNITELTSLQLLEPHRHLGKAGLWYIVINETHKVDVALPYQYFCHKKPLFIKLTILTITQHHTLQVQVKP
jgi:type I site-specific restriction-modification system R (restriction) subunit